MSRRKLRKFMKSHIGPFGVRPRHSRHGRIMVGTAPRGFEDQRPSPYVKRWREIVANPLTGELEVKHHERLMTEAEVQDARNSVKRAFAPTTPGGIENKSENMAPRGTKGAKPMKGAS